MTFLPFFRVGLPGLALVAAVLSSAQAQLPTTTLSSVFPAGGRQGSEFEVAITGQDLVEVTKLQFSHPGITAEPKRTPADEIFPEPQPVEGEFVVKIAGNVPPGYYEVRALGRFGLSNPRRFAVGKLPETTEPGDNTEFEKAAEIEIGSTVNGRFGGNVADFYQLPVKAGERIVVDLQCERIDSRADATLAYFDEQGRELGRVRDVIESDPVLDITPARDGSIYLATFDFLYEGGEAHVYRLRVHRGPQIDAVFPPAGRPGSRETFQLIGRNLPGGKPSADYRLGGSTLEEAEVQIQLGQPDEDDVRPLDLRAARTASQVYRLEQNGVVSNAVRIALIDEPLTREQEPNDADNQAQKLSVPAVVAGRFLGYDSDWYEFEAKKGQEFVIEVLSHRLGVASDPYLLIQKVTRNADGEEQVKLVGDQDDPDNRQNQVGSLYDFGADDPAFRLKVDEDADYRVLVRDQIGHPEGDPRFVYCLSIRAPRPDFRVMARPELSGLPKNNNQAPQPIPTLRRGGSATFEVAVERLDGFDGPVEIFAEGLPGFVEASPALLSGAASDAKLVLQAQDTAPAWHGAFEIVARGTVDGKSVVRRAVAGTLLWSSNNIQQDLPRVRAAGDFAIAVLDQEQLPATASVESQVYETAIGGKLEIPVKLIRRDGYQENVKLSAQGLPNEIKPQDVNFNGADQDAKLELFINNPRTPVGAYTFVLSGATKLKQHVYHPDAEKKFEERRKHLEELEKQFQERVKQAEKTRNESEGDAKAQAEKKLKEEQDLLKRVQDLKKKAEADLKTAQGQNKPKDVNFGVTSPGIRLRVHESPVEMTVSNVEITQNGKAEATVKIERRFGFEDEVEINFDAKGISGLGGQQLKLPQGQSEGKLELSANASAAVGAHQAELRIRTRWNNVTADIQRPLPVVIKPAAK